MGASLRSLHDPSGAPDVFTKEFTSYFLRTPRSWTLTAKLDV